MIKTAALVTRNRRENCLGKFNRLVNQFLVESTLITITAKKYFFVFILAANSMGLHCIETLENRKSWIYLKNSFPWNPVTEAEAEAGAGDGVELELHANGRKNKRNCIKKRFKCNFFFTFIHSSKKSLLNQKSHPYLT